MKQLIKSDTSLHVGYYIFLTILTVWVIFFYSLIGTTITIILVGVLYLLSTGFLLYQTTYNKLLRDTKNTFPERRSFTIEHLAFRRPITDLFIRTYNATRRRSDSYMMHKIGYLDTDIITLPISKRMNIQYVKSIEELRMIEREPQTVYILIIESAKSMLDWTSEDELDAVIFNDQRGNVVGLFYEQYTTLHTGDLKGLYKFFINVFPNDIVIRATGNKQYLIQFFRHIMNRKVNLKGWAKTKIQYDNLTKKREYNKWKEMDDEFSA